MRRGNLPAVIAVAALLLAWQLLCAVGWLPPYMLPSPMAVLRAFCSELPALWETPLSRCRRRFWACCWE